MCTTRGYRRRDPAGGRQEKECRLSTQILVGNNIYNQTLTKLPL